MDYIESRLWMLLQSEQHRTGSLKTSHELTSLRLLLRREVGHQQETRCPQAPDTKDFRLFPN